MKSPSSNVTSTRFVAATPLVALLSIATACGNLDASDMDAITNQTALSLQNASASIPRPAAPSQQSPRTQPPLDPVDAVDTPIRYGAGGNEPLVQRLPSGLLPCEHGICFRFPTDPRKVQVYQDTAEVDDFGWAVFEVGACLVGSVFGLCGGDALETAATNFFAGPFYMDHDGPAFNGSDSTGTDLSGSWGAAVNFAGRRGLIGLGSYNGHLGTDFVLRPSDELDTYSFKTMSTNVPLYMPANGQVIDVEDSLTDDCHFTVEAGKNRCPNRRDPTDLSNNYVTMRHWNGQYYVYTRYDHIRTNSVPQFIKDQVQRNRRPWPENGPADCGVIVGSVGSSGNSAVAHVHFEVGVLPVTLRDVPLAIDGDPTGMAVKDAWDRTLKVDPYRGPYNRDSHDLYGGPTVHNHNMWAGVDPGVKALWAADPDHDSFSWRDVASGVQMDRVLPHAVCRPAHYPVRGHVQHKVRGIVRVFDDGMYNALSQGQAVKIVLMDKDNNVLETLRPTKPGAQNFEFSTNFIPGDTYRVDAYHSLYDQPRRCTSNIPLGSVHVMGSGDAYNHDLTCGIDPSVPIPVMAVSSNGATVHNCYEGQKMEARLQIAETYPFDLNVDWNVVFSSSAWSANESDMNTTSGRVTIPSGQLQSTTSIEIWCSKDGLSEPGIEGVSIQLSRVSNTAGRLYATSFNGSWNIWDLDSPHLPVTFIQDTADKYTLCWTWPSAHDPNSDLKVLCYYPLPVINEDGAWVSGTESTWNECGAFAPDGLSSTVKDVINNVGCGKEMKVVLQATNAFGTTADPLEDNVISIIHSCTTSSGPSNYQPHGGAVIEGHTVLGAQVQAGQIESTNRCGPEHCRPGQTSPCCI